MRRGDLAGRAERPDQLVRPKSLPIDKTLGGEPTLVGGLGIGGDLSDQDDVVASKATVGFEPTGQLQADRSIVKGVRLPDRKFNRHPNLP